MKTMTRVSLHAREPATGLRPRRHPSIWSRRADHRPSRGDTSRNPRTYSFSVSAQRASVEAFPNVRDIAAIRVVPGTGSYPVVLRVRLPPSRRLRSKPDPRFFKESRPVSWAPKTFAGHQADTVTAVRPDELSRDRRQASVRPSRERRRRPVRHPRRQHGRRSRVGRAVTGRGAAH